MNMQLVDLADYGLPSKSEYILYLRRCGGPQVWQAPDRGLQPYAYVTMLPQIETGDDYWQGLAAVVQGIPAEHRARSLLVLDYGHEGPSANSRTAENLEKIRQRCEGMGFSARQICLLQHNVSLLSFPSPFPILEMNTWFAGQGQPPRTRTAEELQEFPVLPPSAPRARRFVCLNYWPRFHRVYAVLYMLRYGLLDRGFVSFPGFHIPESRTDFLLDALCHKQDFDPDGELIKRAGELDARCPLVVDLPLTAKVNHEQDMETVRAASDAFRESYFSLVSETGFDGPGSGELRLTEKILKPLYAGHPFLILGMPGCLRYLKTFGFQGFHPFLDERYDDIGNVHDRFYAVMDEVRTLATLNDTVWATLWQQLQPIAEFNRRHFHTGFRAACYDRFVTRILDTLQIQMEVL
jgi:hypothetical protein